MIKYKIIEEERTQDAPFIGALVCAPSCKHGKCKKCFNQHLKELPNKTDLAFNVVSKIFENPLNEGVIMSGLEWSDNIENAMELIIMTCSIFAKPCILYTRLNIKAIENKIDNYLLSINHNDLREEIYERLYIKTGEYREDLPSKTVASVVLASNNQDIWLNHKKIE